MIIYTKNLKGDKTELQVDPADTIISIKEKLRDLQGHPVELQKLILAGKILDDSKTCSDSGIVENATLVLMVSKPKPEAKPVPPVQSAPPVLAPNPARPAAVPLPVPAMVPSPSSPSGVSVPAPSSAPNPPSSVEGPEALVTGEQLSSTISMICEMGFDRKDVEAAMKAAFNNPDRAIEYLTSGIPQVHQAEPPAASNQQFRQIMQDPQFLQILQMIQQNPAALGPIMQQIQQSNPDLYNLLMTNREEFMQMMQEGNAPQSRITPEMVGGLPRPPPGATVIQLTPEEHEHLKQLMEIGYSKQQALEAYLSCDKNFEWAANYLLENYPPGSMEQDEGPDDLEDN